MDQVNIQEIILVEFNKLRDKYLSSIRNTHSSEKILFDIDSLLFELDDLAKGLFGMYRDNQYLHYLEILKNESIDVQLEYSKFNFREHLDRWYSQHPFVGPEVKKPQPNKLNAYKYSGMVVGSSSMVALLLFLAGCGWAALALEIASAIAGVVAYRKGRVIDRVKYVKQLKQLIPESIERTKDAFGQWIVSVETASSEIYNQFRNRIKTK